MSGCGRLNAGRDNSSNLDPIVNGEPTLIFAESTDVAIQGTEGGQNISIRVDLVNPLIDQTSEVTVRKSSGDLIEGIDFQLLNFADLSPLQDGKLIFPPGATSAQFVIKLLNVDTFYKEDRTMILSLFDPSAGTVIDSTRSNQLILVKDDDPPPPPPLAVQFAELSSQQKESFIGARTIEVKLSRAATEPVSVQLAQTDGAAILATDYTLPSAQIDFEIGDRSKFIQLSVIPSASTDDKILVLTLVSPSPGLNIISSNYRSHTHTILDDTPTIGFQAQPLAGYTSSADEGNSGSRIINIPVNISSNSASETRVFYTIESAGTTAGNTPIFDNDYELTSATLVFNADQTVQNIALTIYGDTRVETNETIKIKISCSSSTPNCYIPSTRRIWTHTIKNDD